LKVGELEGLNIETKLAKTAKEWYPKLTNKKRPKQISFR
jgi:hypothetical protein